MKCLLFLLLLLIGSVNVYLSFNVMNMRLGFWLYLSGIVITLCSILPLVWRGI